MTKRVQNEDYYVIKKIQKLTINPSNIDKKEITKRYRYDEETNVIQKIQKLTSDMKILENPNIYNAYR